MRVGELMTREFEAVHPDATVEEVAHRIGASRSGSLPVAEDDRLIGMIRRSEIIQRGTARGWRYGPVRVRDLLDPELFYASRTPTPWKPPPS